MAEALNEMKSKVRVRELTIQELKVWVDCKEKAARNFALAASGGALVSWFATKRFDFVNRILVTAGASLYCGYETLDRSIYSFIDRILSLDGTWMQRELAASLLRRNQHDPKVMECLRKHFFAEEVYDDSSDKSKFRWRYRGVFEDDATSSQASDYHNSKFSESDQKTVIKESNPLPKQAQINAAVEPVESPFDCIFGTSAGVDEINSSAGSSTTVRSNGTPKKHTHGSKRYHRRHQKHHHQSSEA